jgi:hypothetical protein
MKQVGFPLKKLSPENGRLSFNDFVASIEIPLKPFKLPHYGRVETSILLDCINLPSQDIGSLSGCSFEFPPNPAEGYVDGSIYIGHRHHPVDLLALSFGLANGNIVTAKLAVGFAFSSEGLAADEGAEYGDIGWLFETELILTPAPQIN